MGLSTAWKEIHAYNLNGVHLIWQYRCDLPNRQIKVTAKYTTYMVCIYLTNTHGMYARMYNNNNFCQHFNFVAIITIIENVIPCVHRSHDHIATR